MICAMIKPWMDLLVGDFQVESDSNVSIGSIFSIELSPDSLGSEEFIGEIETDVAWIPIIANQQHDISILLAKSKNNLS